MSKFGCSCGHVLVDQTDFLPYKAHLREAENKQRPVELLADVLAGYLEARAAGTVREFLIGFLMKYDDHDSRESAEYYLDHFMDQSEPAKLLFDLIFPFWNAYDRTIYECEACGRLWIETDTNHFVPYMPESATRGVLWSRHHHPPYPTS